MSVLIAFLFYKTKSGHEIKIVGANPNLAKYSGMRPRSTIFQVMLLSGGIGGMIGAMEVTAVQHRLMAGFNPGLGFDGMWFRFLRTTSPGRCFNGFFFGALRNAASIWNG
jgi:simple sugar transport system permease protein